MGAEGIFAEPAAEVKRGWQTPGPVVLAASARANGTSMMGDDARRGSLRGSKEPLLSRPHLTDRGYLVHGGVVTSIDRGYLVHGGVVTSIGTTQSSTSVFPSNQDLGRGASHISSAHSKSIRSPSLDSTISSTESNNLRYRTVSQIIPEDRRVQEETCFYVTARSLLLSPCFGIFYLCMVLCGLFLFCWSVMFHADDVRKGDEEWFIIMDLCLSILFLAEVVLRLIVMGGVYFDDCFNLLDLILLPCAVASSVLGLFWDSHDTVLGNTILVFRYTVQVFRFVCLLRHSRQQTEFMHSQDKVDFDNMPQSQPGSNRSSFSFFRNMDNYAPHVPYNPALFRPDRPVSVTSGYAADANGSVSRVEPSQCTPACTPYPSIYPSNSGVNKTATNDLPSPSRMATPAIQEQRRTSLAQSLLSQKGGQILLPPPPPAAVQQQANGPAGPTTSTSALYPNLIVRVDPPSAKINSSDSFLKSPSPVSVVSELDCNEQTPANTTCMTAYSLSSLSASTLSTSGSHVLSLDDHTQQPLPLAQRAVSDSTVTTSHHVPSHVGPSSRSMQNLKSPRASADGSQVAREQDHGFLPPPTTLPPKFPRVGSAIDPFVAKQVPSEELAMSPEKPAPESTVMAKSGSALIAARSWSSAIDGASKQQQEFDIRDGAMMAYQSEDWLAGEEIADECDHSMGA
eukprot:g37421.t1